VGFSAFSVIVRTPSWWGIGSPRVWKLARPLSGASDANDDGDNIRKALAVGSQGRVSVDFSDGSINCISGEW
jgi:hypothetical protein